MWLLDVNLPNGLVAVLRSYGIACDTTADRGWRELTNGVLARVAWDAGFRSILTRDRLFAESASKALQDVPDLAIVIVTLPQSRSSAYLAEFRAHWSERRIEPVPGSIVRWP